LRYFLVLLTLLYSFVSYGQKKSASVEGKIVDSDNRPIEGASIIVLGRQAGISSNDTGYFKITVPADRAFALIISYTGYISQQRNLLLNENETERIVVSLERGSGTLESVTITNNRDRAEAGLITINPKNSINIPSPVGGIENMIKVIVGSNNELSSQYSVRGGNYDENLIYVNDFEVFRPYLVRSGQQEGLSFINPELARNVNFYNGGFQAKYGDKMSSVLDVQYRKPKNFGGSVYLGLLEEGVHLEGSSKNEKFSFLVGARNRSNRNLLSSQQTQGNYVPSSSDLQGLLTYSLNDKNNLELLGNLSGTNFKLTPQFSQLTSSVFSPFFTSNLGLDIYFEGREEDSYKTNMVGLSLIQQPRKDLRLKWMSSYFSNNEVESFDITGAYLFGEREFDKTQADFGLITNPLGAGLYQNYARNNLEISVFNVSHKGSLSRKKHFIQWGQTIEQQKIRDKLYEWEYQDSAGYNLPYNPNQITLSRFTSSAANLDITRLSGYIQDNIVWNDSAGFNVMAGVRYNYNTLNKELLLSPRIGFSYVPQNWKKDIVFRGAIGLYHQPPFYRELRRFDGSINENLKAQKSFQVTGGFDYSFSLNNRPFRITTEAYYKKMWDVVPYDVDNVRLRYYGENSAKAYAVGIEGRLYGELVKDAESWISIGFMRTRENLNGDTYYDYTLDSLNKPVDSSLVDAGWLRRPTDRLFNMGVFLHDYLSTNKNFKVYLNLLYGSNMPYNIPNSVKYRNGLIIDPYIRIDLGFSALLMDSEKANRRSHHPFRNFENIWATLEVFNVIDRSNTISYLLIKDFSNTVFAMPNRLTPRLINLKLVARF
jgi:hypothetical protein